MTDVEYLTVEETSEFLRVPVSTLYQWRHARTGPPVYRPGKRLLYRRDELVAWVETKAAS